jgi:hypothetical protein
MPTAAEPQPPSPTVAAHPEPAGASPAILLHCAGIEAFLRNGGTPEEFARVRHRFDARAEAAPGVCWPGIDLDGDDLCGAELAGATLIGAVLPEVNGADLRRAQLERSEIRRAQGAVFDGAELAEADLRWGRLEGASFVGANLACCDLNEAGLRRARFDGADLTDADFRDAELWGSTVHLAARLDGADFSGAVGLTVEQRVILAARGALGVEECEAA